MTARRLWIAEVRLRRLEPRVHALQRELQIERNRVRLLRQKNTELRENVVRAIKLLHGAAYLGKAVTDALSALNAEIEWQKGWVVGVSFAGNERPDLASSEIGNAAP